MIALDDRLSHAADLAGGVLLDHRSKRIRLPRDAGMWPDRDRL